MTQRCVWGLLFVACLGAAGCADNVKKVNTPPDDRQDAGKVDDSGSANGDDNSGGDSDGKDNGATTAGSSGGTRISIDDAPNCADDDPSTPGSECSTVVTCGGLLATPKACPLATHSCCVSGPPMETTVNCYEGTSACEALEAVTPCDGPEDCPDGLLCCVTPLSVIVTTECRAVEDCDEANKGLIFCHSDTDCPEGKTCTPSEKATWWGFCN